MVAWKIAQPLDPIKDINTWAQHKAMVRRALVGAGRSGGCTSGLLVRECCAQAAAQCCAQGSSSAEGGASSSSSSSKSEGTALQAPQ